MPHKDRAGRNAAQQRWREKKRAALGADDPPDQPPEGAPADPVPVPDSPEPVAIDNAGDVVRVLSLAINLALADPKAGPQVKARTIGYLATAAIGALKVRDLEHRVEAIELILKLRKNAS